jgi:hypothetical protein
MHPPVSNFASPVTNNIGGSARLVRRSDSTQGSRQLYEPSIHPSRSSEEMPNVVLSLKFVLASSPEFAKMHERDRLAKER